MRLPRLHSSPGLVLLWALLPGIAQAAQPDQGTLVVACPDSHHCDAQTLKDMPASYSGDVDQFAQVGTELCKLAPGKTGCQVPLATGRHKICGLSVSGTTCADVSLKAGELAIIDADPLTWTPRVIPAGPHAEPARPPRPRPPPPVVGDTKPEVFRVPVREAPVRGPTTAKVTIVEYADFQCPFCSRVEPTLQQIFDTYGNDVRLVFKQHPLPFHDKAMLAAEASLAAEAQGKFWEMHDLLFAHQMALTRNDLESYAEQLGLNLSDFRAALDSHRFEARIKADMDEAANFQANGTPNFFINGRRFTGAQPFEKFQALIDEELTRATALLASGTPATRLYDTLTAHGLTKGEGTKPTPPTPPRPQVAAIHEKDFEHSPMTGSPQSKVTIVEWSDFQCPFCGRALPTIDEILEKYPDVRFVFKHEPLPFHPNAMPAAIASMAAFKQGKFWEFYTKAFANQQQLSSEKYHEWAEELGLNIGEFEADLDDPATKARVQTDIDQANKFGATGTPTFFIDGRLLSGAMPFDQFAKVIDEERKKADAMLSQGTPRSELYEKLLADNLEHMPNPSTPTPAAPERVKVDAGNSPVRGSTQARVTIVEFADFQCPFCARAEPTLKALQEKYGSKLRVVWKNQALPFHPNARPAAKAALAAGEQGKFWEMHDALFDHSRELSPEVYERSAGELGLDMTRFRAALESPRFDAVLDEDSKLAASIGATGTPTFFINGRILVGAQPPDHFEKMIDEELAKLAGGSGH